MLLRTNTPLAWSVLGTSELELCPYDEDWRQLSEGFMDFDDTVPRCMPKSVS